MPYNCVISENPDHLRVDVSGEWRPGYELEDAIGVWTQVAEACRKKGRTRILAVWDVPGHFPTMSAYDLVVHLEKLGWHHRFKLATVHLHQERLKGSLFVETVATNRGYLVKIFSDEESAARWLLD